MVSLIKKRNPGSLIIELAKGFFSAIQPPMSLETNYCLGRPFSWMEGYCCTRAIGMIWCITRMLSVLTACGYREDSSTSRRSFLVPTNTSIRLQQRLACSHSTQSATLTVWCYCRSTPLQLSQGASLGPVQGPRRSLALLILSNEVPSRLC